MEGRPALKTSSSLLGREREIPAVGVTLTRWGPMWSYENVSTFAGRERKPWLSVNSGK